MQTLPSVIHLKTLSDFFGLRFFSVLGIMKAFKMQEKFLFIISENPRNDRYEKKYKKLHLIYVHNCFIHVPVDCSRLKSTKASLAKPSRSQIKDKWKDLKAGWGWGWVDRYLVLVVAEDGIKEKTGRMWTKYIVWNFKIVEE